MYCIYLIVMQFQSGISMFSWSIMIEIMLHILLFSVRIGRFNVIVYIYYLPECTILLSYLHFIAQTIVLNMHDMKHTIPHPPVTNLH